MAKTTKTCIVCGKKFQGTAKAEVCGATCRKRLSRLKKDGKKPSFELVAKVEEKAKPKEPTIKEKLEQEEKNPLPRKSIFDGLVITENDKLPSKTEQLKKLTEQRVK